MQKPKTCVIIINYNGADDTAACVESLSGSDVPVHMVVVDNTPNDPKLKAALGEHENLNIIVAAENLGFGRGNNIGIRWALSHGAYEFIYLLNNDAVIQANTIKNMEKAMSTSAEIGILASRIAYLEQPSVLWYGGGEVDWRRGSVVTPGINGDVNSEMAMTERDVTFVTGCSFFIRRTVLEMIGGFDPRYFLYEEDVELCMRAKEKGVRMRYIPEALVLHRCQGSLKGKTESYNDMWDVKNPRLPFYVFHIIRNRLFNIQLHARGVDWVVSAVFFPLYIIRRAVPFMVGRRWDAIHAILKGFRSFWRDRNIPFTNELSETSNQDDRKEPNK